MVELPKFARAEQQIAKEFVIRSATPDDAERMAEVIANGREQTYGLNQNSWDYSDMIANWRGQAGAATMRNYMEATDEWRFIGCRPRALVAARLADAAIVGVMTTREQHAYGQESINLDLLFVDPEVQGHGLGCQFMDNLTEFAGGRQQTVEVIANNVRARGLYEKYGFEVVPGAVHGHAPLQFQAMVKPAAHL